MSKKGDAGLACADLSPQDGELTMTDNKIAAGQQNSLAEEATDTIRSAHVYLSRRSAHGFTSDRMPGGGGSSCYFEEYELGIGRWKATIVKTLDYGAGRTRFGARYDPDPQYRRRERIHGLRRWRRRCSTAGS